MWKIYLQGTGDGAEEGALVQLWPYSSGCENPTSTNAGLAQSPTPIYPKPYCKECILQILFILPEN